MEKWGGKGGSDGWRWEKVVNLQLVMVARASKIFVKTIWCPRKPILRLLCRAKICENFSQKFWPPKCAASPHF